MEANFAPTLTLTGPNVTEVKAPTAFVASASDPDGAGAVRVEWDFDATDGFTPQFTGATASWTFGATGQHTVTARATDADGMTTDRTVVIRVDDFIVLDIDVIDSASSATLVQATVKSWDDVGIAGATVIVDVYYEPVAGGPRTLLRTVTVTTGADGNVFFLVRQDTAAGNLMGRHVLDARVTIPTSLGGDPESAADSDAYSK